MEKDKVSKPISELANDLGVNLDDAGKYGIDDIFKEGTSPMIFLTKVSNVYSQSHYLTTENEKLSIKVTELEVQIKSLNTQIVTLQKSEIVLKKDNEFLSNSNQNTIPGTVLFAVGSIFIGVCGSFFNAKSYPQFIVAGLIGIALSIFGTILININKRGVNHE